MKQLILTLSIALLVLCSMQARAQGSPDCSTAQPVTPSSSITATVADAGESYMVYYSFTPATDGTYFISSCNHATFDTRVYVYTGPCGNLSEILYSDDACAVQSAVTLSATAGTTYYIGWCLWSGAGSGGTFTWELSRLVSPVFVLSGLPEELGVQGNIYSSADLSGHIASFDGSSGYTSSQPISLGNTYYCQLSATRVAGAVLPFTAADTVRLPAFYRMAMKVGLPEGWYIRSAIVLQEEHQIASLNFNQLGANLFSDTLYMPAGSYSCTLTAVDAQGTPVLYSHNFAVSAAGDVSMSVSPSGQSKQTFGFTNLPAGFVAADTIIDIYDAGGSYLLSLYKQTGCYLPNGTYKCKVSLGTGMAYKEAGFTVSGASTINLSYAGYYQTTFRVQLSGGDSWDSGAEIIRSQENGTYLCCNIAPGDSVAWLPNGSYQALLSLSGDPRTVSFTVSGANSLVSYVELKPVFTFADLPAGLVYRGEIFKDEYLRDRVGAFSSPDYQLQDILVAGQTYYCQLEGYKMPVTMVPFTAAPTVSLTTGLKQTTLKVGLPAGWTLNSTSLEILQDGQPVTSADLEQVAPQQYADTVYLPAGSYSCTVGAYDPQGLPISYPHSFTVSAAGEVAISVSAAGQSKQTFSFTNLPSGFVAADTAIEIYDALGNDMLNLYGQTSCYLSNGAYYYSVMLNSKTSTNIAPKEGSFTVSGEGTVSISFADYRKVDFRVTLPAGNALSSISVYQQRGSAGYAVNLQGSDTSCYLAAGSYYAIVKDGQGDYYVRFTVSSANRVVPVEVATTRFTVAGVPAGLLRSANIDVYNDNGSGAGYAIEANGFEVALVKGGTYSYYISSNSSKLTQAKGSFTAAPAVTLSPYGRVVVNVSAPGQYRIISSEVWQSGNRVLTPTFGLRPPHTDTLYMTNGLYQLEVTAKDTVGGGLLKAGRELTVAGSATVALDMAADLMPQVKFVLGGLPADVRGSDIRIEISNDLFDKILRGVCDSASLPNGRYYYNVSDNSNKLLPLTGSVTLDGANQTVQLSFAGYHKVTFTYTLPANEPNPNSHYIDLYREGQSNALGYYGISGASTTYSCYLPDGSYRWALEYSGRWTGAQQPFTVNGRDTTLSYIAQPMYKVAFVPTGARAKHTYYSIRISNGVDQYIEHFSSSRTDSLRLPAGDYEYEVLEMQINGADAAPYTGRFTLGSGGQTVNISFENYQRVRCWINLLAGTVMPSRVEVLTAKGGELFYEFSMSGGGTKDIYLPAGSYTFTIAQPGYKVVEKSVAVAASTLPIEVQLDLQSGSYYPVMFGVFDGNQNGIAGATVTLGSQTKATDAVGRALFTDMAEGTLSYSVIKSGYRSEGGTLYVGPGAELSKGVILLQASQLYSVSFDVYDGATGTTRLSGATVSLQGVGQHTTDGGAVSFSGVAPGTYSYSVSKAGYVQQSGSLTVSTGNVSRAINLVKEPTYTLQLAVYDGSSTTFLSGASVNVTGQAAQTVAGDTLRFSGLAAGDYTLSVSKAGYFAQSSSVTLSAATTGAGGVYRATVNMVAKPANLKKYTLTFKVYDGSSANLLSGASVALAGGEPKTTGSTPLSFAAVDSGDVVAYSVGMSGYVTVQGTKAITAANAVRDTVFVSVALQASLRYTVEFKVYDGSGTSYLSGASVSLQGQAAQTTGSAALSFTNLLPGSYSYTVSKSGYQTQSGTLSITAALDAVGRTLTQVIHLAVSAPNAVDKNSIAVVVYPNPASQTLYIRCDDSRAAGLWSIKLYSVNGGPGVQMQSRGLNTSIPVGQLPAGLYILQLRSGNSEFTQKVMIK